MSSAGTDQGCAFVVRLPAVSEPATRVAPGPDRRAVSLRAGHLRVLVVDEDRDSAASLSALLGICGCEVDTAHDGLEAIAAPARFRPDLVLLDIGMPGLDGYATCRRIRERFGRVQPRIFAVTGWGREDDLRRSREAGCDGHLVKPVDRTTLLRLLDGMTMPGSRIIVPAHPTDCEDFRSG